MTEVIKLIEYAELSGFRFYPNGDKLTVKNGSNLPYQLKRLLTFYKNEIIHILESQSHKNVS